MCVRVGLDCFGTLWMPFRVVGVSSGRIFRSVEGASTVSARLGCHFGLWGTIRCGSPFTVNLGRISICVEVGSDGFGIFWAVFWVVAVGLGLTSVYGAVGLDGL